MNVRIVRKDTPGLEAGAENQFAEVSILKGIREIHHCEKVVSEKAKMLGFQESQAIGGQQ
jgi:hypothetical protein